jgi:splicing factor 1
MVQQLEVEIPKEDPIEDNGLDSTKSQAEDREETKEERRQKRKKSRWGNETEAGMKVLAEKEEQPESEEPPAKKRRSRWEPAEEKIIPGMPGVKLPAHLMHLVDVNPETLELQRRLNSVRHHFSRFPLTESVLCTNILLLQINQQIQLIQAGKFIEDDHPDRSPSPEPVYNESGVRVNTREQRVKEKLMKERQVSFTLAIYAASYPGRCISYALI